MSSSKKRAIIGESPNKSISYNAGFPWDTVKVVSNVPSPLDKVTLIGVGKGVETYMVALVIGILACYGGR